MSSELTRVESHGRNQPYGPITIRQTGYGYAQWGDSKDRTATHAPLLLEISMYIVYLPLTPNSETTRGTDLRLLEYRYY